MDRENRNISFDQRVKVQLVERYINDINDSIDLTSSEDDLPKSDSDSDFSSDSES